MLNKPTINQKVSNLKISSSLLTEEVQQNIYAALKELTGHLDWSKLDDQAIEEWRNEMECKLKSAYDRLLPKITVHIVRDENNEFSFQVVMPLPHLMVFPLSPKKDGLDESIGQTTLQ